MKQIELTPQTVKAFAGVRGRVLAAVAAQPRSVSFADALAQVSKARKPDATNQ